MLPYGHERSHDEHVGKTLNKIWLLNVSQP
jgi:hypothetical protein